MRMDKLTNQLQTALADAQSLALGKDHNFIEPVHLLSALLEQPGGSARPLLQKAGANLSGLAADVAQAEHRPLLVYVQAPWCGPCAKMEKEVFPEVWPLMKRFARAKVNFDDNESELLAFGERKTPFEWATTFGAEATPTYILLSPDGRVLGSASGFVDAKSFSLILAYVSTNAYQHATFEEYIASVNG